MKFSFYHIYNMKSVRNAFWILGWTLAFPFIPIAFGSTDSSWRYWKVTDGLSESYCHTVSIGYDGDVWVNHGPTGTISHLTGYYIRNRESVFNLPSPGPYVKVVQDRIGNLFSVFFENSGGFQQYLHEKWIRFPSPGIPITSVLAAADISFHSMEANKIVYVVPEGAMEFNADTRLMSVILSSNQLQLGNFIQLSETSQNPLWITADRGVVRLQSSHSGSNPYSWKVYPLPESFGVQNLREPYVDEKGTLYVTGDRESKNQFVLLELNGDRWRILYEGGSLVRGWRDTDGVLWLQKDPWQIVRVYGSQEYPIEKKSSLSGQIYDVALQTNGVVWVATSHGLARYSPALWRSPSSLLDVKDLALSIYEDPQGRLWCAYQNALAYKERDQWRVYPFPEKIASIFHFQTETLGLLSNGRLAIGAYSNYHCYFAPESNEFQFDLEPANFSYQYLAPKEEGGVWLVVLERDSDRSRLMTYDGNQYVEVIPNLKDLQSTSIKHVYQDRQGKIWIGTTEELAVYDKGKFQLLKSCKEERGQGVFYIHEIRPGVLWFGGRNAIHQFDGKRWELVRSGLDAVRSMITAKDGSVWIATQSGMYRYLDNIWTVFTDDDGLPDTAVYEVCEDRDGHIWAGTSRGISMYDPDADRNTPDTYVFEEENLRETPPDGQVRISFSGVDKWNQTVSDRLLYSYRIDRQPWSPYLSSTYASFANLSSGAHLFEVRAMDRNRNIDLVPALFDFTVLKPWYQQLPLQIVLLACACTILFLVRLLVHRYLQLEKLVGERTADLTRANQQLQKDAEDLKRAEIKLRSMSSELILSEERERRRIAAGLHDRIGHALAFIKIKIGQLFPVLSSGASQEALHSIQNIVDDAIKETHALTFELSPPILYELGLEKAIHWLTKEYQKMSGVAHDYRDDGLRKPLDDNVRIFLFQTVRELLMNVTKHSKASRVGVSISHGNDTIEIAIEDNGVGFRYDENQAHLHEGFGLFSIFQRLKHIGGDCCVDSKLQQGAKIVVKAPFSRTEDQ